MKLHKRIKKYVEESYIEELLHDKQCLSSAIFSFLHCSNESVLLARETQKLVDEYLERDSEYCFRYKTVAEFFDNISVYQYVTGKRDAAFAAMDYLKYNTSLCEDVISIVARAYEETCRYSPKGGIVYDVPS